MRNKEARQVSIIITNGDSQCSWNPNSVLISALGTSCICHLIFANKQLCEVREGGTEIRRR